MGNTVCACSDCKSIIWLVPAETQWADCQCSWLFVCSQQHTHTLLHLHFFNMVKEMVSTRIWGCMLNNWYGAPQTLLISAVLLSFFTENNHLETTLMKAVSKVGGNKTKTMSWNMLLLSMELIESAELNYNYLTTYTFDLLFVWICWLQEPCLFKDLQTSLFSAALHRSKK